MRHASSICTTQDWDAGMCGAQEGVRRKCKHSYNLFCSIPFSVVLFTPYSKRRLHGLLWQLQVGVPLFLGYPAPVHLAERALNKRLPENLGKPIVVGDILSKCAYRSTSRKTCPARKKGPTMWSAKTFWRPNHDCHTRLVHRI